MVKFIKKYLGFRNWGIIRYNTVIQNISIFFYIALTQKYYSLEFIRLVFLFMIFSLTLVSYGYLVNDLADVDLDRKAGKRNVFSDVSRIKAILVISIVFLFMIVLGFPFLKEPSFFSLWFVWILITTFYSVPPLRLKERGGFGLAATIAGQQPLPAALMFSALYQLQTPGAIIFILYITVRGISADVGHQMRDRLHDVAAGAPTFAVRKGKTTIARLYGVSLELEKVVLGLVLILFLLNLPSINVGRQAVNITLPLFLVYLFLLPLTLGKALNKLERDECVDPYDESVDGPPRDLLHFIHHAFPSILMPFYLALCLALNYWPNVVFIITLAIIYQMYQPVRWTRTWPIRSLLERLK